MGLQKSYADGGPVQHKSCDSWQEFERLVEDLRKLSHFFCNGQLLFRGQADSSWHLQSRIEREIYAYQLQGLGEHYTIKRNPCSASYQRALSEVLGHFKNACIRAQIPNTQPNSDLDWWCLGRHHGLYTPLLDWTTDYLVAAYFAFCGARENDSVAIWVLLPSNRICATTDRVHGEIDDTKYLQVIETQPLYNPRQAAQRGVFTVLNSPIFVSIEEYIKNINSGNWPALYKISLPPTLRDQVLAVLRDRSITAETLGLSDSPEHAGAAIDQVAIKTNELFVSISSQLKYGQRHHEEFDIGENVPYEYSDSPIQNWKNLRNNSEFANNPRLWARREAVKVLREFRNGER